MRLFRVNFFQLIFLLFFSLRCCVYWQKRFLLLQTPITKTTHRLLPKRNNLSRKKASNCLNPSPRRRLLRCLSPPRLRKPSRARTSPSLTSLWRTWTFWASSPSRCSLLSRCPFWSSCTWNPRRKATFPVVSRNRTTTSRRRWERSWRTKPPCWKAKGLAWDRRSKHHLLRENKRERERKRRTTIIFIYSFEIRETTQTTTIQQE